MAKTEKVEVEYVKGGKRKRMNRAAARILEKLGQVRRVEVEAPAEPEKKKRGRPRKVTAEAGTVPESEAPTLPKYRRRDLRADD